MAILGVESAIFGFDNPNGGEAEYHVDTDYLDDNWVPRGVGLEVRVAALGYAYAELLACRQDRVGYAIRSRPRFAGSSEANSFDRHTR
jgi:hypothetical protein